MNSKALISWIGVTDLRASRGELSDGAGPVANAATKREFDEIHLLSDHKAADSKAFAKWLKQETGVAARIWPVRRARGGNPPPVDYRISNYPEFRILRNAGRKRKCMITFAKMDIGARMCENTEEF